MSDKYFIVLLCFLFMCAAVFIVSAYESHQENRLIVKMRELGYQVKHGHAKPNYVFGVDLNMGKIVYITETEHMSMYIKDIIRAELFIDGKLAGKTLIGTLGAECQIFDENGPERAEDIHVDILSKSKTAKPIRIPILTRLDYEDMVLYIQEAKDILNDVCFALNKVA